MQVRCDSTFGCRTRWGRVGARVQLRFLAPIGGRRGRTVRWAVLSVPSGRPTAVRLPGHYDWGMASINAREISKMSPGA